MYSSVDRRSRVKLILFVCEYIFAPLSSNFRRIFKTFYSQWIQAFPTLYIESPAVLAILFSIPDADTRKSFSNFLNNRVVKFATPL